MEKAERSLEDMLEQARRQDPTPIFLGAVLSKNNQLPTNRHLFYSLINEIKNCKIDYPDSIKPMIDNITIRHCEYSYESEEIGNMFFGLLISKKIGWHNVRPGVDCYQLTDDAIYGFLEEWQDDYEALEFFERCGDYLSLEDK